MLAFLMHGPLAASAIGRGTKWRGLKNRDVTLNASICKPFNKIK